MIRDYGRYSVKVHELLKDASTKSAIDKALSTYPLYKAKKIYDLIPTREELNTKLLNHYKYREIGFESVGRFVDELSIVMCEIMPYYNEMFKTIEIMADLENPFDNVDVVETFKEKTTGTTSSMMDSSGSGKTESTGTGETSGTASDNGTTTGTSARDEKKVSSLTPQGQLSITANNIDSVTFADNVEWNKENKTDSVKTNTSTSTSSNTNTSDKTDTESEAHGTSSGTSSENKEHTFTKKGNQGVNTYAHDMNEFRTTIIDVVNEIINDKRVAELFMLVF